MNRICPVLVFGLMIGCGPLPRHPTERPPEGFRQSFDEVFDAALLAGANAGWVIQYENREMGIVQVVTGGSLVVAEGTPMIIRVLKIHDVDSFDVVLSSDRNWVADYNSRRLYEELNKILRLELFFEGDTP